MQYDKSLGRFLALCLKADRSFDEAYYTANSTFDFNLASPEILDHWGKTYRNKVKEEYDSLPDNMRKEQLVDQMGKALENLDGDLDPILSPDEEAQHKPAPLVYHKKQTETAPHLLSEAEDQSLDSNPHPELIEIIDKLDEVKDLLLNMQKSYPNRTSSIPT